MKDEKERPAGKGGAPDENTNENDFVNGAASNKSQGTQCNTGSSVGGAELEDPTRPEETVLSIGEPAKEDNPNSTDTGNAKRLSKLFRGNYRYCVETKRWYYWTGARWKACTELQMERLAKAACNIIRREAAHQSGQNAKELVSWSLKSEAATHIFAMIRLAQSEPGVEISATDFDTDPLLLGVQNGTIELRTGAFRASRQSDYITKQTNVAYDPKASCPRWNRFIDEITQGDRELARHLQKLAGYWLTGLTDEQQLFILYGEGSNGKSAFWTLLYDLLGDYAKTTKANVLMVRSASNGATPELAQLPGARLVVASEPRDDEEFEASVVKEMTGGDPIQCRGLYQAPIEFKPQFKVVLSTNHKPYMKDTGHAIWRRIHLIPFNATFPVKADKGLENVLKGEKPGILNWALEGCRHYLTEGLKPLPKAVVAATNSYRDEMDVVSSWVKDECIHDPTTFQTKQMLHGRYRDYCEKNGYPWLGERKFGDRLEKLGFPRFRTASARGHKGLKLA